VTDGVIGNIFLNFEGEVERALTLLTVSGKRIKILAEAEVIVPRRE